MSYINAVEKKRDRADGFRADGSIRVSRADGDVAGFLRPLLAQMLAPPVAGVYSAEDGPSQRTNCEGFVFRFITKGEREEKQMHLVITLVV